MTRPYYKKSHRAWYVNINKKQIRLSLDETEARAKYTRMVANQEGNYTVGEIVKLFLAVPRKPTTQKFYARPLRHFVQRLGSVGVNDLKPYHIRGCRNDFRVVKACFRWAERQEYIKQSPLRNLQVPSATSRGDKAYLTPAQWEKFIQSISGDLFNIAIMLHETGCRPKEARQVEARHFDRVGRCFVIPAAEAKGEVMRVIHLSDRVFALCQRLVLTHPDGSIFRRGSISWTSQSLWRAFSGFGYTPYCLRHTFATEAIIRGVDLQTIAILLGHADLKMLSSVYQHIRLRSGFIKQGLRRAVG